MRPVGLARALWDAARPVPDEVAARYRPYPAGDVRPEVRAAPWKRIRRLAPLRALYWKKPRAVLLFGYRGRDGSVEAVRMQAFRMAGKKPMPVPPAIAVGRLPGACVPGPESAALFATRRLPVLDGLMLGSTVWLSDALPMNGAITVYFRLKAADDKPLPSGSKRKRAAIRGMRRIRKAGFPLRQFVTYKPWGAFLKVRAP